MPMRGFIRLKTVFYSLAVAVHFILLFDKAVGCLRLHFFSFLNRFAILTFKQNLTRRNFFYIIVTRSGNDFLSLGKLSFSYCSSKMLVLEDGHLFFYFQHLVHLRWWVWRNY